MTNKNKILIILLCLGMIVGIFFSIFYGRMKVNEGSNNKKTVVSNSEIDKIVEEASGQSKEDVSKMTEDEKQSFMYGDGKNYTDAKYRIKNADKEFPEIEARNLLTELMGYAEVASYDKIIDAVGSKIKNYNFTEGTNLRIASIYHDASLMMTTLTVPEIQRGKIAVGMKDPEMMLIGTLMLTELSRRDVIVDKRSLSPVFDGAVKIKHHEMLNDEKLDIHAIQIKNTTVGAEFIHKIEFEIEGNNLFAYITEFKNSSLELYGIYSPEGKEYHYKDINFWESIDKSFNEK